MNNVDVIFWEKWWIKWGLLKNNNLYVEHTLLGPREDSVWYKSFTQVMSDAPS